MKVTQAAADRIRILLADDGRPGAFLRVSVEGGGCQGFSYAFAVACDPEDGDTVCGTQDAPVRVDAASAPFLKGSTLDWESGLMGERFRVHNPNATSSCGCGTSFSA